MNCPKHPLPPDFDWEFYLERHPDLGLAGIDTKELAIGHFLAYGRFEKRAYASRTIVPNPKYENASVLVVGTSREIEIFNDRRLAERVEEKLHILCINTAFHYFNRISCLFLNGRFTEFDLGVTKGKVIDEIYAPIGCISYDVKVQNFSVVASLDRYSPEISTDLNKPLPHGPTTMLDIVFPFCAFHKVGSIHIIGAEYNTENPRQQRHIRDAAYLDRSTPSMDRELENAFALRKLDAWHDYFHRNNMECFALSPHSKTPFRKKHLSDLLNE